MKPPLFFWYWSPSNGPTTSIVMLILILYTFSSRSSLGDSVCSLRICLDLYLDGLRWVSRSSSCSDWTSRCFVILILQEHKVKQMLLHSLIPGCHKTSSTVVELNSRPQQATWLTCGVPWQSFSVCLRGPASHESEQMFLWSRCHQGSQPHRTHCCKKQKHSSQPDRWHVLSIQQIWLNYHVAHCGYIRTTAGITSRGQMQTNTHCLILNYDHCYKMSWHMVICTPIYIKFSGKKIIEECIGTDIFSCVATRPSVNEDDAVIFGTYLSSFLRKTPAYGWAKRTFLLTSSISPLFFTCHKDIMNTG